MSFVFNKVNSFRNKYRMASIEGETNVHFNKVISNKDIKEQPKNNHNNKQNEYRYLSPWERKQDNNMDLGKSESISRIKNITENRLKTERDNNSLRPINGEIIELKRQSLSGRRDSGGLSYHDMYFGNGIRNGIMEDFRGGEIQNPPLILPMFNYLQPIEIIPMSYNPYDNAIIHIPYNSEALPGLDNFMEQKVNTPLTADAFKKLKQCKFSELGEKKSTNCTICLSDYDDNENIIITPCNHYYHPECLQGWTKTHHTCPVCRSAIGDHEYDDSSSQNNNEILYNNQSLEHLLEGSIQFGQMNILSYMLRNMYRLR